MATSLIILIFICLMIVALGGAAMLTYLAYAVPQKIERWAGNVGEQINQREVQTEAQDRRVQLEQQINDRINGAGLGGGVDKRFVQAQRETRFISGALALLKEATKNCCEVQRFKAELQGYEEMSDVRLDPTCTILRSHVMDIVDVTLDHIERYPFVELKLMKQSIAMQAVRDVCADCELLHYSVANAPRLCSPARHMGNC